MSSKSILEANNVRLKAIENRVEKLIDGILDGVTEEKTVAPDFSKGNIVVTPSKGKAFASVTVEKPDALLPDNIRSGVEVGGVIGTYETPTEDEVVSLDFSKGDQVVTSDSGNPISKVTITKPSTLLPKNILGGVTIAGVSGVSALVTQCTLRINSVRAMRGIWYAAVFKDVYGREIIMGLDYQDQVSGGTVPFYKFYRDNCATESILICKFDAVGTFDSFGMSTDNVEVLSPEMGTFPDNCYIFFITAKAGETATIEISSLL